MWELEVGHTVTPAQGLPDPDRRGGVRRPEHAGRVRRRDALGCGHLRRRRPLPGAVPQRCVTSRPTSWSRCAGRCQSPRTNLLLADDVGLGKTIEAGLVIQELLLRHRARAIVIVSARRAWR